ncbi:MAG: putative porin [Endomicrobiales bacterium]
MTEGGEEARQILVSGESKALPSWIQNLTIKGDLRLRHQLDWDSSRNFARTRERLRLRTGFETRVKENMKAGFGLATGSEKILNKTVTAGSVAGDAIVDAEPASTNHTFSNGFGKPMLMVDFAYLEYTPCNWLKITGGKMKAGTPLWNPTDLLWDTDINPDGVAVTLSRKVSESLGFFLNGGWLIMNELNTTADDPDVIIAQPGFSWKPSEKITLKAAVAYQQLNVNGKNTGYYGTPAFDYLGMNPGFNISVNELVGPYSLALFGDMIQNGDSKPAADKAGSAFGLLFGDEKLSTFGQWQATFIQRRLETNAWLAKLGDSDAYGGAVNSQGYEAIVTLGLTKSASLGFDYYQMDAITGASVPKSLLQIDLVYKF